MEIDYAAIIAKANVRKDVLQELEAALQAVPGFLDDAEELCVYLAGLKTVAKKLDAEGRQLLPPDIQKYIEHLDFYIERAQSTRNGLKNLNQGAA